MRVLLQVGDDCFVDLKVPGAYQRDVFDDMTNRATLMIRTMLMIRMTLDSLELQTEDPT